MLDIYNNEIENAGYSYDAKQDIFISTMNAWQRNFGYCRMYDEVSAPLGMIIDCEPIYFEYNNKRWMIEIWKGQYDLSTGSEIGIYTTSGPDLNIHDIFDITFYNCADEDDSLFMSYNLKKNGKILFTREDIDWWLTGFKLGEFSEPSELTMEIDITFKSKKMRNAFWIGLNNAGYLDKDIYLNKHTLSFLYDKPHTPQPISRQAATDWIIQRKNQKLCEEYQVMTKSSVNMDEKLKIVQAQNPNIFENILNMGRSKPLFKFHDTMKNLNGVQ
jgi:hypothetical protein